MASKVATQLDNGVSCKNCQACCCRLVVMLISDTGVPANYIEVDKWGGMIMARLDDGWCAALDRSTMECMIYENRPWICRDFVMGDYDCLAVRAARLSSEK